MNSCNRHFRPSRNGSWLVALSFLLFSTPTTAADHTVGSKTGCPPSIQHRPAEGVAYQPGVDAQGWAVTPADVTPPTLTAEDLQQIDIPVRMPVPTQNPAREGQASVETIQEPSFIQPGVVSVNTQDGSVTFNGKDLRPIDPAELDPDCISQETP